ncbi:M14 family metallopeptidase [Saccharicrinis sp. FJH62]|uniref:M14 family metallopeptidase n=1 Tax=Saccharicrinis sp. FJH62 TaxID=3344657 RepID=UPI0035D46456
MKKVLKISLYTLFGIIVLVIGGSYVSYRNFWAEDPLVQVDSTYLSYYHETYNECRDAFVRSVENIETDFDSVKTGKMYVPGSADDDLTIDWCYIPAKGDKEKLLILNSGLHGIEGYTGSAIQSMFIDKILKQQLPDNMGVLFLHGLNPYGFKYHRKVTENNVDLNRNCLAEGEPFDIKNEGYAEMTDFLMPSEPVNYNSLHNRFFHLVSIYMILQKSMPVLRQAALQGQYDYNKGIYYGGKDYEPQVKSLKPFLTQKIQKYKMVLNVDLHTGYGERGKMHLFIDKPDDEAVEKGIETIFKGSEIDWGSSDDFYTINGEYITWVNKLVPDVLCIPMCFEYGTLNSQETFGSLKSIQIMILENEGAHYGYKDKKNETAVKHLFDEMYFPSSPAWRSKVMSDSYTNMGMMMENFKNFEED